MKPSLILDPAFCLMAVAMGAVGVTSYVTKVGNLNLLQASAKDVSAALDAGQFTSLQLVNAYLDRIEAHNINGTSDTLDALMHSSISNIHRPWSPRYHRDRTRRQHYNTDVELGMNTTAGSHALLEYAGEAKGDAFVVKRLRDAGAIILAKANLDEYSGIRGVNASAWSPRGGQVSCPYVVGGFAAGGDPSGSSSGSGAGVAAGFAPLALGSDTEGSIVNPSSRNALFGLRPSTGTTSRSGVVPISSSQDTTGPMGKSTWDVAVALDIMAAEDPDDPYTFPVAPFRPKSYTKFLDPNGFKGLRVGVIREPFFDTSTKRGKLMAKAFNKALKKMTSFGAIVRETPLPNYSDWNYTFVGAAERTARTNSSIESLEGVIDSMTKLWSLESPEGQCCMSTFIAADQLSNRDTSGEYWLAKHTQEALYEQGPAVLFRKHDLDVLVLPTEFSAARLGAVGRLPVGNVPLGYDGINLPFGMAFVGRRYDEGAVIRAMSAFEAKFPARKVPSTLE
ncbi:Amidase [Ilyonectria robusta]